jgi:zinc protease
MTVPLTAASVTRTVLPNGMVCLVKPSRESGVVALHGYVKAGSIFDAERPGLARFAGSTLIRGSLRRTGPEIAEDLDALGATLTVSPGIEVTAVVGRALADDLRPLLETAAEILVEPAFAASEVENVRGELITAARVNALDTRQVAERAFRRLAYPEGHPHSRSPDGDEAILAALDPADLRGFHVARYRADATVLTVVGDVDPMQAADLAAEMFGRWQSPGRWSLSTFPDPMASPAPRHEETVVPGKTQSDLVLGAPGVARTDPDYHAVMMANLLLGQLGMMGRIGRNVRERQGMAYYAFSDLRAGFLAGPWWVKAGVNPANVDRAIAAILHEVDALQRDGPLADELADARTFLTGSLAVRLETSQGVAQMLADIELYALGLDYLERFPGIIADTSREAIMRAIWRFPTEAYTLAVAGPDRHPPTQ